MKFKVPSSAAFHLLMLGFVCAVVFFVNLGRIPFYDKGEPREALVVRDIVVSGNWVFPMKLGQQIPSKPPLFHWIGAAASVISGRLTETTVRFPSAFLASLGVFLIYYLGRKLYDSLTGLIAGLILATAIIYQTSGVEARVDMTLTFWLTLPLVLFYGLHQGFLKSPLWTYGFFLTAGISVLAKGPVSLVLSALIIAIFLALKKQWRFLWRFAFHPGVILAIAVPSLWYGGALWSGGEQFFGIQFIKENFERFFIHGEEGTGHQKPVYYFIPYLFTLSMPWTLLLPYGVIDYFRWKRFKADGPLFLGIWVAVIFAFFSISAGKRPPYILPLYPPLALLLALAIRGWQREIQSRPKGLRIVAWCAAMIGVVVLLPALSGLLGQDPLWFLRPIESRLKPDDLQQFHVVREVIDGSGLLFPFSLWVSGLIWLLAARSLFFYRWNALVSQLAMVSVLSFAMMQGLLLPGIAHRQSYKAFVEAAERTYGGRGTLYLFTRGLDYTSIIFYSSTHIHVLPENDGLFIDTLSRTRDYVIVGEPQSREIVNRFSLSLVPLLRSTGTGPNHDSPLILLRGATS